MFLNVTWLIWTSALNNCSKTNEWKYYFSSYIHCSELHIFHCIPILKVCNIFLARWSAFEGGHYYTHGTSIHFGRSWDITCPFMLPSGCSMSTSPFFFFLERKSVCKEVFLGKWLFVYWKIRVRRICALLDTYLSQRISQCSKAVWTPTCMREIFLLNPLTYLGSINNLGKWNFASLIWNNFTNMNPYIEQPQT